MTDFEPQHARLAPSSANRWGPGGCPGSVAMEERIPPDPDSEEAREGTAAHHYLMTALQGHPAAVGTLAPNGFPIDQEMVEAAADLIQDVHDTMRAHPGATVTLEDRVHMTRSIHPDCWGTLDICLVDPLTKTMFIWEYKYGHRYVDPYRNWQAISYAIGKFESLGYEIPAQWGTDRYMGDWRITVTIAQPRNYAPEGPMREWYIGGKHLQDLAEKLKAAAYEASQPDAPLITGSHCRDCRAIGLPCAALMRAVGNAIDVRWPQRNSNSDFPPEALGLQIRVLRTAQERIKAQLSALEELAIGLIKQGKSIPWSQLGSVNSRRVWKDDPEKVAAAARLFGIDLWKPAVLTPAQALKAGAPESFVNGFSDKPQGALKLLPMDENSAARVFGDR